MLPRILTLMLVVLALTGCGGGGGGGSNNGGGDPPPPGGGGGGNPPPTFSVTAMVKDLNSEGLMLAFNGTPVSVASGASIVTLGTALSVGTAYTVSVQRQPPTQTCSVDNGSGTMPANDVTDVAITCSLNTYAIGGSISGLTAKGLVLVNNEGDATSIETNARFFTMQSLIAHGSAFEISVQSQPFAEVCTVSQGSGVATEDVNSVMIGCKLQPFTLSTVHTFGIEEGDGELLLSELLEASDGNFYGTTSFGGTNDSGTVFRLTPTGEGTVKETVLHSFGASGDGRRADAALIQASDGNFYGTTLDGGTNGSGTVFRLRPTDEGAFEETVLHSFGASDDGASPRAALIQASDGNFYGTTFMGGAHGFGTVFRLTPKGEDIFEESVLHSFGVSRDGRSPNAELIQASDGNFYGTTSEGGANGDGTVFRLTLNGGGIFEESVLHSFGASGDGEDPAGALIQASDGAFYGTTRSGGATSYGTVFRLTLNGGGIFEESVLHSFGVSGDGQSPNAGLLEASDGNFYGTTFEGGAQLVGTVFRLTPMGEATVLYSFGASSSDGFLPAAALIQASDGAFYGTTTDDDGNGTVFRILPQ